MNIHVDVPGSAQATVGIPFADDRRGQEAVAEPEAPREGSARFGVLNRLRLKRTAFGVLSLHRILRGGRVHDAGRLPRYVTVIGLVTMAIWIPVLLYLNFAETRYSSDFALILPGNGVSTSLNLSEIGQSSSSANSAYSSSAVSPTVTYKKLLQSRLVLRRAEGSLSVEGVRLSYPRIKLVDQTSLIQVSVDATTPEEARQHAEALLRAFRDELSELRQDEIEGRQRSTVDTLEEHKKAVDDIRNRISSLQMESGLTTSDQFQEISVAKEALVRKITDIRGRLARQTGLVQSLAALLDISPENAAASIRLHADTEFQIVLKSLAEETARLAELDQTLGGNHPNIVDLRKRVLGMRLKLTQRSMTLIGLDAVALVNRIDHSPDGERAGLLSQLMDGTAERAGLEAELAILESELASTDERLISLLGAASELDSLNRDYKVAEAVFASALARSNTLETDVFASYPMVQLIEPPTYSESPTSPNRLLAFLFGFAATLCALGGLILLWIRRPLIDWMTSSLAPGGE